MLFPLDGIRPGDTTVDLTVTGNVEELSANVSKSFSIPKPPGPGEARPWFLSDHLDRMGDNAVLVPSLDGIVTPDGFVAFMGYGCAPKNGSSGPYAGSLVPLAGGPSVALAVTWLKRPEDAHQACGWLAGRLDAPLPAGLWSFKPPKELGGGAGSSDVEFTVLAAITPEGVAAADTSPK